MVEGYNSSSESVPDQSDTSQDTQIPQISTTPEVGDVSSESIQQEINSDQNQNGTRTVSQFYRDIGDQVTPETPNQIMEASGQAEKQVQEISQMGNQRRAINQEVANAGMFEFGKKKELKQQDNALEQKQLSQRQEFYKTQAQLQELRSPAQELNANIASDQEVARTLNPNRLEELANANEGNEIRRVVDLTPEEVAARKQAVEEQRAARLSGDTKPISLPEDQRNPEQKGVDILEQQEEYKKVGVEKLAHRLLQDIQGENQSVKGYRETYRNETIASWNEDFEGIKSFAERAYSSVDSGDLITNGDIERGYWALMNEAKELDGKFSKTTSEKNQVDYLKHRAEKVEKLQREALVPMAMWHLNNELSQAMGIEPASAEEFLNEVDRISDVWPEESQRYNHYLTKARRYRDKLPWDRRASILREITMNPEAHSPHGTYFEGILEDISDLSRKSAEKLSPEDLTTVIAYYTVALEKGIDPVDYENLSYGIEFALQHILKNPSSENLSVNNVPDFIRKIRHREEIKGQWRPDFRDITGPYQHMMSHARAWDIHTKMAGRRF
jgi:hypothetical protein